MRLDLAQLDAVLIRADLGHRCSVAPLVSDTFLASLKAQTHNEHIAIERSLDLIDDALTLPGYRRRLGDFYGFYRPLEERLCASDEMDAWPGTDGERLKTGRLAADLDALGVEASWLPLCTALPPLASRADRFGCLYVLEGATLGAQVIVRHLRRTLGITPAAGASFFYGHGDRTGAMWQSFRATLTRFAADDRDRQAAIASGAIATFRSLRHWLEGSERDDVPRPRPT